MVRGIICRTRSWSSSHSVDLYILYLAKLEQASCCWESWTCKKYKLLPSAKLTWQWNIPVFNRTYIFKWPIFHCYVSLPDIYMHCFAKMARHQTLTMMMTPTLPTNSTNKVTMETCINRCAKVSHVVIMCVYNIYIYVKMGSSSPNYGWTPKVPKANTKKWFLLATLFWAQTRLDSFIGGSYPSSHNLYLQ